MLDGLGGIARGALEQAAGFLENGLVRILPIAIGFLANQVGLSGLGRRIGEMIETVREYVNRGIDWLINTSINALNALLGRGEEEEESGDVRTAAQNRLQRELRAEHSIDEVRAILSRTLSDLQTRGLRRLELGAANEDGSYAIIAEASPAADLMRIIPKVEEAEGASVRVFARLTLEGSSDAFGAEDVQRTVAPTDEQVRQFIAATYGPISDPAQFLAAQQQARQALSTTATVTQPTGAGVDVSAGPQTSPQRRQHGAQLAPRPYWLVGRSTEAAHGRSQHGGAVFEPAEGSNTVEGVFWSLGKLDLGRIGDNSTHAEAQFIEWYEQRLAESVRRRVRRIELQIDPYSPCWTCSGALVGFINRARQNGPITASLTWSKPYLNPANRPGERSGGQTTPSSLGDLISAQWSVQPASLPQSETEGEAGYIVAST
ncbi:MAG TPA: hypothetical protein PKE45_25100 [Caldilineaceae bacterium]|nr:hypothetical protein [Caldilineaceae bacterium]